MSGRYDDIMDLPHHVSRKRKRMSMEDRAAQFNPFAALTGYEDAIEETGRLTDRQIDWDLDGTLILDERLRSLAEHLQEKPEITVTYFVPDSRKSGGAYVDVTGRVAKMDLHRQKILMNDGTVIDFGRIRDIRAEFLTEE